MNRYAALRAYRHAQNRMRLALKARDAVAYRQASDDVDSWKQELDRLTKERMEALYG